VVILVASDCGRTPTSPSTPAPDSTRCVISGVARYRDGRPVNTAKVWADTSRAWVPPRYPVFSDNVGRYTLVVTTMTDSLTLFAREGFAPGIGYTQICSGQIRVRVAPQITQDIVCDFCMPI
jgi:hypothetical protein